MLSSTTALQDWYLSLEILGNKAKSFEDPHISLLKLLITGCLSSLVLPAPWWWCKDMVSMGGKNENVVIGLQACGMSHGWKERDGYNCIKSLGYDHFGGKNKQIKKDISWGFFCSKLLRGSENNQIYDYPMQQNFWRIYNNPWDYKEW